MEFRFRAGEDRTSSYLPSSSGDGFFTAQALRAGIFPNPVPGREALRRELEKERIREEIIAREIVRKRELEEEVRREMQLEREIARRHADRFSLASSLPLERRVLLQRRVSEARVDDRLCLSEARVEDRLRLSEARVEDRLPVLVRHRQVGAFERLPVKDRPEPLEKEVKPLMEVSKGKVLFFSKNATGPSLAGTKRKAVAATSGNEAWLPSSKKTQKEWSCALCQVSTTSKEGLNDHLQGKKHKAKEAELGMSNTGAKSMGSSATFPKKADKSMLGKKGAATNKPKANRRKKQEEKQQQIKGYKKRFTFFCKLCRVKCNSEFMKAEHCNGKRHISRLEEVKKGGGKMDDVKAEAEEVVTKERDEEMEENVDGNGVEQVEEGGEEVVAAETDELKDGSAVVKEEQSEQEEEETGAMIEEEVESGTVLAPIDEAEEETGALIEEEVMEEPED
ncbi:uncharacterized protein LOC143855684 [Tasmannia lanceolata]|uniref:uncharacterized protein LOC143855684 n=1 Tax=Tasmannia lanceolata TaxID=3420 RepID=UPI0040632F36